MKQARLRGIRLAHQAGEDRVTHFFPFFTPSLEVRLHLAVLGPRLHLVMRPPLRPEGPARLRARSFESPPRPLQEARPEDFAGLLHFDPWWTMRSAAGVPAPLVRAILATNVAGRRHGHLEIREIVFSAGLDRVREIHVGDGVFRPVVHGRDRALAEDLRASLFGP